MKPPVAKKVEGSAQSLNTPPADFVRPVTLTKRSDFLTAARAQRVHTSGFVLQARKRDDADPAVRVGFTCSKKVGNAVARNKAKRRLREIARLVLPTAAPSGWDFVLIGRKNATATLDFLTLQTDLKSAVLRLTKSS
jgi:ribonuclease P protein component